MAPMFSSTKQMVAPNDVVSELSLAGSNGANRACRDYFRLARHPSQWTAPELRETPVKNYGVAFSARSGLMPKSALSKGRRTTSPSLGSGKRVSSHRSCHTDLPASRTRIGALRIDRRRIPDGTCRQDIAPHAWNVSDILEIELEPQAYNLWHERAVFHFLTTAERRLVYVQQVTSAVKRGGHVIVSTFGREGLTKCSGLEVMRYDAESLHGEFGGRFRLVQSSKELHQTRIGTAQQFLYCYCRLE